MQLRVSFGVVRSWSFCALKQGLINLGKFQKDLILFVRSCCFSGLIQGLENLEAPGKETGLFFSRVRKERGVHQRFANLWTPGTIQIAGRQGVFAKTTGIHQVTG